MSSGTHRYRQKPVWQVNYPKDTTGIKRNYNTAQPTPLLVHRRDYEASQPIGSIIISTKSFDSPRLQERSKSNKIRLLSSRDEEESNFDQEV